MQLANKKVHEPAMRVQQEKVATIRKVVVAFTELQAYQIVCGAKARQRCVIVAFVANEIAKPAGSIK